MEIYKIFASFFLISQKWQKIADKEVFPKINITIKQWLLIAIIQKNFPDYPPTINEAAEAYGSSHQNIKKLALELQKQNLLIISIDPNDKRSQRLILTGMHKKYFEGDQNVKWQEDFVSNFFVGLSQSEIKELNRYIDIIINRINILEK